MGRLDIKNEEKNQYKNYGSFTFSRYMRYLHSSFDSPA
jgi:hypothetical protein